MIDKEKIKSALEGKEIERGRHWSPEEGVGCVLGTLLVAAGYDQLAVARAAYPFGKMAEFLEKEYGLSYEDQGKLMTANDDSNMYDRKASILRTLEAL